MRLGAGMGPEAGVSRARFSRTVEPFGLHAVCARVLTREETTDSGETGA